MILKLKNRIKKGRKNPLLECNVQKPIVGDNEADRKLERENSKSLEFIGDMGNAREDKKNGVHYLKVQLVDLMENGADKNVEVGSYENVAIREEDASKMAEFNEDVPEMKGREEREKVPPLECDEEPRKNK
ncbi:Probable LRR receptor-like serine/threonine-protein kinase At4g20940 [Olea europaea subsp. europaea]|uniref:Probable LRR receptor-like serine/threonine-protein kinase At4g20940 n=1 Tax=Olea europaea subsp. europaea TaxID=158383 RepID=A0A8S0RJE6_OLEEU|nr:Probable LRR receptor-like serine/threonine-protein kinase At4g20940 [Olea europaea subsp. europaea]